MSTNKGYTAIEKIIICGIVATVCAMGGLGYVVYHFVSKIW